MNGRKSSLLFILAIVVLLVVSAGCADQTSRTVIERDATIASQQSQINSLNSQVSALSSQISSLQGNLASANMTITSLQGNLTATKTQLDQVTSEVTSLQNSTTSGNLQIADLQNITSLTVSTPLVSYYSFAQNAQQTSPVCNFTANYAGYVSVSGTSTSNTGYIGVTNSFNGFPNGTQYKFSGSTISIPVLPGKGSLYFGNDDTL